MLNWPPFSQVVGPVLIRRASISPPSYLMILLNHIRLLLVPARGSPFSAPFPSPPPPVMPRSTAPPPNSRRYRFQLYQNYL